MQNTENLKLLNFLFVIVEPNDREKMYIESFVKEYGLPAFLMFLDVFDFTDQTQARLKSVNMILQEGSNECEN